ncbi:helix-turn-helix transcriptional regulator [Phytoactinopolyspora halotolerans]|uniref:Helix-turn-helix domain-containing protein n=1 Tax=Phytoactinopolyspora halotolerans TaxID=1981512 RepID=A0A6L9SBU4_9ACTN|nr:helix-turn-helix domain-containing protein [Phytoactinopolyspora halotolerans]NEE02072.1 helix-turn-helix domain-containing protein [Phytoactinopolyspora halotolerans]
MSNRENRTWTPEDVAEYLGVPISTLYRWRYIGYGPRAARVGRHLRYLPEDVRAWLHEQQEPVV